MTLNAEPFVESSVAAWLPLDPSDLGRLQEFRRMARIRRQKPSDLAERRASFDAMVASVPWPSAMAAAQGEMFGVPGAWCRPAEARPGTAILYLHGGGYMQGKAASFLGLAGQIAELAATDAFIPEYRLAPEHAFPAAIHDALAAYSGLAEAGFERIAIVGDSAGGGMALAVAAHLIASTNPPPPCAVAAMSPLTDLAVTGPSIEDRAAADPMFTREMIEGLATQYLQRAHPESPLASPLYGRIRGLPPLRIDVGADEILLDDSVRFAERARSEGVDATLEIWEGMPHVFQLQLGQLGAAERSLARIGAFLREHLHGDGLKDEEGSETATPRQRRSGRGS